MFCYKCAAQNAGDARFCRSCGINLEVISLAITGKLVPAELSDGDKEAATDNWQKKYSKGLRDLCVGSLMMTVSLIVLFVPMLFIHSFFFWLIIWSIFL